MQFVRVELQGLQMQLAAQRFLLSTFLRVLAGNAIVAVDATRVVEVDVIVTTAGNYASKQHKEELKEVKKRKLRSNLFEEKRVLSSRTRMLCKDVGNILSCDSFLEIH